MKYQIIKPEITNTRHFFWNTIKAQWTFWLWLLLSISASISLWSVFKDAHTGPADIFFIVGSPVLVFLIYLSMQLQKIVTLFWIQIAEVNGWKYVEHIDVTQESGALFKRGHSRSAYRCIEGVFEGRTFRIFNYKFTIGAGKHQVSYRYIVFSFLFEGNFPHIYLNNKSSGYDMYIGEELPVPAEFEKSYTLTAPRKYEIEALEIFTPEVFERLLEQNLARDVELVGKKLYMIAEGSVDTFEGLEKEFNIALELEDLFDEKLDRFKFTKIGDMPHILK